MKDHFFVLGNREYLQILYSEILYIEALKKYIKIYTLKGIHLVSVSLCYAEKSLPADHFCRVHKSYIISLRFTKKFDNEFAYVANKALPVGKHYKDMLLSKANVWKKELTEQHSFPETVIEKLIEKL